MRLLPTTALAACFAIPLLSAQLEEEIPLGIEAVTGIRSDYVYRGFNLGDTVMDFQAESEIVLSDTLSVGAGAWLATGIGEEFTEGAGALDLHHSLHEDISITASASYHTYNGSILDSGFDLGSSVSWHVSGDCSITLGVHRNLATNGWYADLGADWSFPLSDDTYLALGTGVSALEDYYGLTGLNDFHGQLSFTCNLNSMLSITPFVGWSCELDVGDGNEIYAGLWFEVSF